MSVLNLRVLITGAASGLGRSIAELLADGGARVVVGDIDETAVGAFAAARSDIHVVRSDAGSEDGINDLFAHVRSCLGGLDVLINNAGIAGPTVAAEELTLADWNKTLGVNLTGHFLCARRAIPFMKSQRSGSIVNISSVAGKVGLPMRLPYAVSKAAVMSLAQNLARELGPFNIRVNAILPGLVDGERIRRVIEAKAAMLGISVSAYAAELIKYTSMRTMVSGSDIAAMALFLASDASSRISGQMIAVDGDLQYEF